MVMLPVSMTAVAYNIAYDGIYYNIVSEDDRTVEVTFSYGNSYSGNIVIPSEVVYSNKVYTVIAIGNKAFYNDTEVISVTIPNSVTLIGESAFYNCSGLTSITIPNSVTSIGESAFYNCSGLTSITIPNSVTSIEKSTFYGCSSLTSVVIPNSVTTIGSYAFYNCYDIHSLTIGSGVKSILYKAFSTSHSIVSITKVIWLPNTPPEGYDEISGTKDYVANASYDIHNAIVYPFLSSMFEEGGIKYVPVSPSDRTCDAIDCVYDNSAADIVITKTVNHQGISMSLQNVNDYLCHNNDSIKTVTIKDLDVNIGNNAFSECNGIESVNVQELTGNIGEDAFFSCDGIETVNIQELTGNIGESAFHSCGNLETVNIQGMTGNIGNSAFTTYTYVSYTSGLKTVDIQGLTGNIGEDAFSRSTNLETVNLHDMEGSISKGAFSSCRNLKGIDIPNTVTSIGESCFSGCSSLAYANIGSGINSLPDYCFNGTALTEIRIPQTVAEIGDNVFDGCSSLANVYIEDRKTELALGSNDSDPMFSDCPLDSIYIGGNISYETGSNSGYSPFYRNTSLRAVKITDQETEISTNEFYGCSNLQRVELGDGIESIGDYAFSGCSAIESFTFGNNLQTIGQEAFSDCTAMTQLISRTEVPPVCGTQALDDINKWNCTLLVPDSSIDAYRAADQWKEFFFIESSSVGNIVADECAVWVENGKLMFSGFPTDTQVNIYNIAGQLVHSGEMESCPDMPTGLYIVAINGLTYKILVK